MRRIVFLLEEFSMEGFLEVLLPRFFPDLSFQCVPHEGKQDLEKSIPRKLRAWRDPDAVVRPSAEVRKLVPEFQAVSGARRIACHLTRDRNRSASFRTFLTGIDDLWRNPQIGDERCPSTVG